MLAQHGYRTIAFCTKRDVSPVTGMDRGFKQFNPLSKKRLWSNVTGKLDKGVARMMGTRDNGLNLAVNQLKTMLPRLNAQGEPFFIFLSTVEAHIPYRPPKKYTHFVPSDIPPQRVSNVNMDRWKYMAGEVSMDSEDFEILCALYDGGIAYTDAQLAVLFSTLQELGMLEDMLIIITGDHGENLGEHGLMAHGYCLYDTVIHVPLLIHYPQGTTAPGRVTAQVQSVDVLPTILTLLGEDPWSLHPQLQGNNLLSSRRSPYTVAEQANPDLEIFRSRFPDTDVSHYDRYLRMIRTDGHKFIWGSDGKHELYDLKTDSGETKNLIETQPDTATALHQTLDDWLATNKGWTLPERKTTPIPVPESIAA